MRSPRHLREARKRVLDASIRAVRRRAAGPRVIRAFHQLLATVQSQTDAISPRRVATALSGRFVEALFAIASHCHRWCRPPDTWVPPATSAASVLASLAEHLFATFPVPRFMNSAWLGTRQEQSWYIRLGAGESVRALDFPIRLNRRMAHAFRSAPDDLSILAALRWAEVRGMDGSPELARAIAKTRLGREAGDDVFNVHVIAFLVAQGETDFTTVDTLVELIHARQRREEFAQLAADAMLCALGRKTRDCILHEYGLGQAQLRTRPPGITWKPAPFAGLRWFHFDPRDARHRTWRIAELRTAEDLRQEGIAMRHCVATYAAKCAFGGSSIWSMTVEEAGLQRRAVTIEVNVKKREICQVKGIANRRPKPRFVEVLRRWVEEQGLSMPMRI